MSAFGAPALRRSAWSATTGCSTDQIAGGRFPPSDPGPWRWKLAYIGRIDPRKGIHLAVRALAPLPVEAELAIVGGVKVAGELAAAVTRLAEDALLRDWLVAGGRATAAELDETACNERLLAELEAVARDRRLLP